MTQSTCGWACEGITILRGYSDQGRNRGYLNEIRVTKFAFSMNNAWSRWSVQCNCCSNAYIFAMFFSAPNDKLSISLFSQREARWENFNPTAIKGLNRNCSCVFSGRFVLRCCTLAETFSLSFRFYFVRPQILTELTKAAAKTFTANNGEMAGQSVAPLFHAPSSRLFRFSCKWKARTCPGKCQHVLLRSGGNLWLTPSTFSTAPGQVNNRANKN